MKYVIEGIGAFVGVIAVALFLSFVMAWPVMALWNGCFVGAIDGVREIGWLQAWGLQILFALLFKTTATKKD
jgi:hypothetical protein